MAKMRSDQQALSRYNIGGDTEFAGGKIRWWERRDFPKSDTDVPITITAKYAGRPDKLAYDVYGSVRLMWAILQYNNIVNPIEEFVIGATILLPTSSRMFGELLSPT